MDCCPLLEIIFRFWLPDGRTDPGKLNTATIAWKPCGRCWRNLPGGLRSLAPEEVPPGNHWGGSGIGRRFKRVGSCLRSLVARVRRRPVSASTGGDRDRDPDDRGGPGGDPPDCSGGYSLRRFLPRRFPGLGRPAAARRRFRLYAGLGRLSRPRFPSVGRDSAGNGSKAHGEEAGGAKDRDDGVDRRPEMGSAHVKPPLETTHLLRKRYVDAWSLSRSTPALEPVGERQVPVDVLRDVGRPRRQVVPVRPLRFPFVEGAEGDLHRDPLPVTAAIERIPPGPADPRVLPGHHFAELWQPVSPPSSGLQVPLL